MSTYSCGCFWTKPPLWLFKSPFAKFYLNIPRFTEINEEMVGWNFFNIHPLNIHPLNIHPLNIHLLNIHPLNIHPLNIPPLNIHPLNIPPLNIHPLNIHPLKIKFVHGSFVFSWTAYIFNFRINLTKKKGTRGFNEIFLKN